MKFVNRFLCWAFWLSLLNLVIGYLAYSRWHGADLWSVLYAIEYLIRHLPSVVMWSGVMTICGVLDDLWNEWRRTRGDSRDSDSVSDVSATRAGE